MTTIALLVFLLAIAVAWIVGHHIEEQVYKKRTSRPQAKREKLPKEIDDSLDDFEKFLS
jgi:hypothetical protein